MKKMALALAVLAVVGMSSIALAEVTFTVKRNPDPHPLLASLTVHMFGTNGIENLKITTTEAGTTLASVHQANFFQGAKIFPTLWLGDFTLPDEALAAAADTHILYSVGDGTAAGSLPTSGTETNGKGNPVGYYDGDLGYTYGMGVFNMTGAGGLPYAWAINGDLSPTGYDLLQVVLKRDAVGSFAAPVWLVGKYADLEAGLMRPFAVEIKDIPEPSTIAMLVAGALGLLIVRRRRK